MKERFFNPWVGPNYFDGLGKNKFKILILGASLYCNMGNHCSYYGDCTSGSKKDSSPFNECCEYPEVDSYGNATPLADYTKYVTSPTIKKFEKKMKDIFEPVWDYTAFTEYVQYFMDHKDTKPGDLTPRDFNAFLETLDELEPNIVIVWGDKVSKVLRKSIYKIDLEEEQCDFAWDYNGKIIRFICCTHPAAPRFSGNFPGFAEKVKSYTEDQGDEAMWYEDEKLK